ncbi:MAG: type II toxin-antitoxin system VapC family toxin [Chloroflexi bacterium]|nr:type II toxin-antitoxin system VapC family toxin [Chloroflexota bacterium]
MTTLFLDTSVIVKHYRAEQGTANVDALFHDADNSLHISEIALVEFASALQRLKNSGEITDDALAEAQGKFDADVEQRLVLIDLNRSLIVQAKSLVKEHGLRTLDALHLASSLHIKAKSPVFVSADSSLIKAAQANGLQILNPLASA